MTVSFVLDGVEVTVPEDHRSLLDVLRDELGVRSAKDGCSPQGQCGCCTVWVDATPRVACVTPIARVAGRSVTTVDGLADAEDWADAFCAVGASQCGFCTPGIIMRLAALRPEQRIGTPVDRALRAHLCRCTGWQTIHEACGLFTDHRGPTDRDLDAAARRAELEGGSTQRVGPAVALGQGGFADDGAPPDALVAVLSPDGDWVVAETTAAARDEAGVVPGRRTTAPLVWPIELPPGEWARTLRTTWVEPAALEPDTTWCAPGGDPAPRRGNGGAFGANVDLDLGAVARRLADEHERPVRVRLSREDVVRQGVKRPPLAVGVGADGSGKAVLARPAARSDEARLVERIAAVAPGVAVEFVDVAGPPVGASLRGAGWAEVAAVVRSLGPAPDEVRAPGGGAAQAVFGDDGSLGIEVSGGAVLDEVVLRSYCIGAAHMALGFVRREGIAVDADGTPLDLTIRSFGILRSEEMPRVEVRIRDDGGAPRAVSGAVFSAVLAAAWREAGHPECLPARR
jgi:aerobic-type carbon monoxide dehydrogenase small subunit (CoxS/CutS family)